ncbi:hypothetical protein HMI55_004959 [Coelomomyces lativittatus]|nr:hypothetical protein HMI55_004959 [Coelomomyces lativittatus]
MTKPYTPHVAEQMYYQFVIWIDQPDQMMVVDDINAWQANVQLDKSKLDQVGEKGR